MSKAINIRRDIDDPFYRYKMPALICKGEGKGNGLKTVIVNMAEVAKALARPPAYPAKCILHNLIPVFGGELGTQVKIDEKKNHYVINGSHEAKNLQTLLDVFIDKFVLCQACKNPETEFEFTKDDFILKDCKACGIHSPVDMRHKLSSYILKNRPEVDKKKETDRVGASAPAEHSDQEEGMMVDDQMAKDLAALPTAEERGGDDDDWAVDTSVEVFPKLTKAAAARMKELAVNLPGDEDELKDPVEEFAKFVTEFSNDVSDEAIIAKADDLEVRDDKAVAVLVQLLLDGSVLKDNQIEKRAKLFQHFCKSEKAQKGLLGGIERLVVLSHSALLPSVSLILKALYENDLVEEHVFLAWDGKTSKKYVEKKDAKIVREKALPFTNWLREAEEIESETE